MFGPGKHSEHEVLVGFIDQQLDSIRASAYGLTEEQARLTPCRSVLSVGGLVKHATWVLTQRPVRGTEAEPKMDESGFAEFMGSFTLSEDESLADALTAFDAAREIYLANIRAADPAADMMNPPAPWDGVYTPTPSVERFELAHHIEEFARHAGHADIVREQIDGADAASLLMAVEGREGNQFVQPWTPPAA